MTKEEFKEMSLKSKLRWFFGYYGLPILVVIVVLWVTLYFLKSVFFPEPLDDICVLMYTDEVSAETALDFQKHIVETTGHTASVVVYNVSDPYGSQAFAAKIGVDQTDIVIAPEAEMGLLNNNGYLLSTAHIEGTGMYMGIPRSAREGELLRDVVDYLLEELRKEEPEQVPTNEIEQKD